MLYTLCEIREEVARCTCFLKFLLVKIFYTIPVRTAAAERTFSALRRLKTHLRTAMPQPRLHHTMLLYVHIDRTDEIYIVNLAGSLIQGNERRRKRLGNHSI